MTSEKLAKLIAKELFTDGRAVKADRISISYCGSIVHVWNERAFSAYLAKLLRAHCYDDTELLTFALRNGSVYVSTGETCQKEITTSRELRAAMNRSRREERKGTTRRFGLRLSRQGIPAGVSFAPDGSVVESRKTGLLF
jgi:hypothetical protein